MNHSKNNNLVLDKKIQETIKDKNKNTHCILHQFKSKTNQVECNFLNENMFFNLIIHDKKDSSINMILYNHAEKDIG